MDDHEYDDYCTKCWAWSYGECEHQWDTEDDDEGVASEDEDDE